MCTVVPSHDLLLQQHQHQNCSLLLPTVINKIGCCLAGCVIVFAFMPEDVNDLPSGLRG